MRKNTLPEKIVAIGTFLRVLMPVAVLAGLLLGLAVVNLIAATSPQADKIRRAQELAIMCKQDERDQAEFARLRKKHGLTATAVVIYEPGETPYYYGSDNAKNGLK